MNNESEKPTLPKSVQQLIDSHDAYMESPDDLFMQVYRLGQEHATQARMLDDKALEKLAAWKASQDRKVAEKQGKDSPYYGAAGGAYVYTYCPTGLGLVIRVRNDLTKDEINLTDYGDW